MTSHGALFGGAWLVGATGLLALVRAAAGPALAAPSLGAASTTRTPAQLSREYRADSLLRVVVARDVFRFGRRAAGVPYDPLRLIATEAPASVVPKPTLLLVGVIAGGEPTAVIEGFLGTEGARVVRVGDVVAGLRVQGIMSERVRIVGMDTTWVLKVREPWK